MRLEAAVTRSNGSIVTTSVSDLSLDGCCLSGGFLIGEQIRVTIPRIGTHFAQIRWSFMDRAGARFISAVPRAEANQNEGGSGGGT